MQWISVQSRLAVGTTSTRQDITPSHSLMKFTKSIGTILLAIYLILLGLIGLDVGFPSIRLVMAILPLVAGILLLVGK